MTNVFENPWLLLTLSVLALVPAAIVRQAKPQWGYRPMLIPLLLAGLGFALDYAVQTDKEKILAIIQNCRTAATEGQIHHLSESVCQTYDDGYHRSKSLFIAAAERIITRASISKVRFQKIDLNIENTRAVVEMDTVVHLNPDSQYAAFGSLIFVSLRMECTRQPSGQWCIISTGVTSVNNQPTNWGATR